MTKRINNAGKLHNFATFQQDKSFERKLQAAIRECLSKHMGCREIMLDFLAAVRPTLSNDLSRIPYLVYSKSKCRSRIPAGWTTLYTLVQYVILLWWGYNDRSTTDSRRYRKRADAALTRLWNVIQNPTEVHGSMATGYWIKCKKSKTS